VRPFIGDSGIFYGFIRARISMNYMLKLVCNPKHREKNRKGGVTSQVHVAPSIAHDLALRTERRAGP
jgi:hypothetical protein